MGQPEGGGQTRDQGRAKEQDDRLPEGLHAEDRHPESGAPQGHQQVGGQLLLCLLYHVSEVKTVNKPKVLSCMVFLIPLNHHNSFLHLLFTLLYPLFFLLLLFLLYFGYIPSSCFLSFFFSLLIFSYLFSFSVSSMSMKCHDDLL